MTPAERRALEEGRIGAMFLWRPDAGYEFIGWDNELRIARGLPPRGVDEPPACDDPDAWS